MDHKEQHHQHHQKEREHAKKEQKEYERRQEKKRLSVHPMWYGLGIGLILVAMLIWIFVLR
jgi:hypothetical protein